MSEHTNEFNSILSGFKDALDNLIEFAGHDVVYRYKDSNGKVVDKLVRAVYFQRNRMNNVALSVAGSSTDILEAYAMRVADMVKPVRGDLIVEFYAEDGELQLDKVMIVYEVMDWTVEKVGDNSLIYVLYVQRKEFSKWASSRDNR